MNMIKEGTFVKVLVDDTTIQNVRGKRAKVTDIFELGVVVEFQIIETCKTAFFEWHEIKVLPGPTI